MDEPSNIQALPMPDEMPLHGRFELMRLGLMRSYYYYEARLTFWNSFLFATKALETLLSLSAFAAICNPNTSWISYVVAASAFMTFTASWFSATKRITCLTEQKLATKQTQNMLPSCQGEEDEELYKKVKKAREALELRDDVIFECLDAICHNKACVSLGIPERYLIDRWRRVIGRTLPIPYTEKSVRQTFTPKEEGVAR